MSPRALAYVVVSLLGLWFVVMGVSAVAVIPTYFAIQGEDASVYPQLMMAGSALNAIVPFALGLLIIALRHRLSVWAAGEYGVEEPGWDSDEDDLEPRDLEYDAPASDSLHLDDDDMLYEPELTEVALRRVVLLALGIYLLAAEGLSNVVPGWLGARGRELSPLNDFQFVKGAIMALIGAGALLAANWSHRDRYYSDDRQDTGDGAPD